MSAWYLEFALDQGVSKQIVHPAELSESGFKGGLMYEKFVYIKGHVSFKDVFEHDWRGYQREQEPSK